MAYRFRQHERLGVRLRHSPFQIRKEIGRRTRRGILLGFADGAVPATIERRIWIERRVQAGKVE